MRGTLVVQTIPLSYTWSCSDNESPANCPSLEVRKKHNCMNLWSQDSSYDEVKSQKNQTTV